MPDGAPPPDDVDRRGLPERRAPNRRGPGRRGVRSADAGSRYTSLALRHYEPVAALIRRFGGRITELMINGPEDVWVCLAGEGHRQIPARDVKWATLGYVEQLCSYFSAVNGVLWHKRMPILACRTPDGHRFQAVVGNNVGSGFAISIRVQRMMDVNWSDFGVGGPVLTTGPRHAPPPQAAATDKSRLGDDQKSWRDFGADRALADRIEGLVADGGCLFVSGGTGTGKTTFLNMVLKAIPLWKRVITIEDTPELNIANPNKVSLLVSRTQGETDVGWQEAIDSTLRLRPDAFTVGELSIPSAFPTLQAMDTGHSNFSTSMHANTPLDALRGFRRRVALGGGNVGTEVSSFMDFVADNVDMILQIERIETADGRGDRRQITSAMAAKDLVSAEKGSALSPWWDVDLSRAQDTLNAIVTDASGALFGGVQKEAFDAACALIAGARHYRWGLDAGKQVLFDAKGGRAVTPVDIEVLRQQILCRDVWVDHEADLSEKIDRAERVMKASQRGRPLTEEQQDVLFVNAAVFSTWTPARLADRLAANDDEVLLTPEERTSATAAVAGAA